MAELPFPPNPRAAADWLANLEKAGPKTRAHRVYQALKILNYKDLQDDTRLAVLESLRSGVFAISEILAVEFTALPSPLTESARNTAKLSAFLHHEIAAGYESLGNAHFPLAAQRALTSVGQLMLRVIQLGEPVSSTAWRRLFQHYRQGEKNGWLDTPIPDSLGIHEQSSVMDQIKCILAFVALTPMRDEAALLPSLLAFLEQHKDEISISDTPSPGGWIFDPHQPHGPHRAHRTPVDSTTLRYLALEIKDTAQLPGPVRIRWQHHFGRLSELVYQEERRVDELWCGWDCTLAELKQWQKTPINDTDWLSVPDFELILPDESGNMVESSINPDWHRPHRKVNALLKQCSNDSLAVLETGIDLIPGELLGLKLLNEAIIMAVVRWARPGAFGNKGQFGLDLLEGKITRVKVIVPGRGPNFAIHITPPSQAGILLLPQVRLKPGMTILVEENELTIARLMEWGNNFCAYLLAS